MITQERLKEVLHYDPETGDFTWLKRLSTRAGPGDKAGCIGSTGYPVIGIDKVLYKAHRLAWLYMEGEFPAEEIDHINMVRDDNRWCNLRLATRSQNFANRTVLTNNKSGFKGVCLCPWRPDLWRAFIGVEGKLIHLGNFPSPEEAHRAYEAAAKKYFGEYARTK